MLHVIGANVVPQAAESFGVLIILDDCRVPCESSYSDI